MSIPSDGSTPQYNIVMLSFAGMDTAGRVLETVKRDGGLENCEVEGDAVISRQPSGKIQLHEKGGAVVGATFGVAAAGILGLVTGPVGLLLMVIAGGVVGGVAGHMAGRVLQRVAEDLPPDSSAYLAVVDSEHADELVRAFESEGPRVLNIPVETEIASAIREGITHQVTRV